MNSENFGKENVGDGSKGGSHSQKGFKSFLKNHGVGRPWSEVETTHGIKVAGLILLSLLSVFVLVKTMGEIKGFNTIGEMPNSPYMITVNGKAEIPAVKDIASISFTSNGKGKTATEAQSKAAEANNKAIEFAKSKGIDAKDITTENYNTYPVYDQKVKPCLYETVSASAAPSKSMMTPTIAPVTPCANYESVITGYETSQTVRIKIRGIDKNPDLSGEIITGLGAAGVQVGNLQMTVDNPDELKKQARMMAIADARRQAKDIAKAMGGHLGKATSYYDNDTVYPYSESAMAMDSRMMKDVTTPDISAGEAKITSNVSVTFELR